MSWSDSPPCFMSCSDSTKSNVKSVEIKRLNHSFFNLQGYWKHKNTGENRCPMWKFRWENIVVLMIHPCCCLTVTIHLTLSKFILLSTLSLYIATGCLRFSNKVHHLISLGLSNAWLARQCMCR